MISLSDKMRIYIAGRVRGNDNFKEKFDAAELMLKKQFPDAEIINPVVMTAGIAKECPTFTHHEYMELCICALDKCTHIFLMENWNWSSGAKEEVKYALECSHKILTMNDISLFGVTE